MQVCVYVVPFGEIIPTNNAEASSQRVRAEVKKCGKTHGAWAFCIVRAPSIFSFFFYCQDILSFLKES